MRNKYLLLYDTMILECLLLSKSWLIHSSCLFSPLPKSQLWNIDPSWYWYAMSDFTLRIKFQTFILRCKPCLAQLQILIPISLHYNLDSLVIQNTWSSEAYFGLWLLHNLSSCLRPHLIPALSFPAYSSRPAQTPPLCESCFTLPEATHWWPHSPL